MTSGSEGQASGSGAIALDVWLEFLGRGHEDDDAAFERLCRERSEIAHRLRELRSERRAGNVGQLAVTDSAFRERLQSLANPPSRDRRFRREGEIARGGMGVIHKVRDLELDRSLALKEMMVGPADHHHRTALRFLEEAQITAQLDHPGIVPVHDVGLSEDGRIYFAMKLVRGRDLKTILDLLPGGREGWNQTRALGVLLKVCEAMAYAHSKGVIHRDLKPGNVMVGNFGEVYVMDWGLARAFGRADLHDIRIQHDGDDVDVRTRRSAHDESPGSRLVTMDGDVIGTPAYMPPEQARGEIGHLSPRSDVYAVGAMLYHLLTGQAPFVPKGGRLPGYIVLARLRHGSPQSVTELNPGAPGELVAICEKAMARDPEQRYAETVALGDEIRAYLEGRVVRAFETGAWAEARKWVNRNRRLAVAIASGVFVLIVGAAATTAGMLWALSEKSRADTAAKEAEDNAALARRATEVAIENEQTAQRREAEARVSERRAEKVTALVQNALISSDPNQGGAQQFRVVEAMEAAMRELERGSLRDDPATEAGLQATIAKVLDGNARSAEALHLVQQSLRTRLELHEGDHPDTANSLDILATCLRSLGRSSEALPHFESALEMWQRLFAGDHPGVAAGLNNLAGCLESLGRAAEALPKYEASLEIMKRLFKNDHSDVAAGFSNLGHCLDSLGRTAEALPQHEAALEMRRRLFKGDHPDVAVSLNNSAYCLLTLGRAQEALSRCEASLEMRQRIFEGDHYDVATALNNLGLCLSLLGRAEDALPRCEASLEMRRRLFEGDHPDIAVSLDNLARCLEDLGRAAEALPMFEAALEMDQRLFEGDHPQVAVGLINLADCLESLGRAEEALPRYEAGLEMRQRLFEGDNPDVVVGLHHVAYCLQSLGRAADALPKFEASLAMGQRLFEGDHQEVAVGLNNLALCLESLGRPAEALPKYELSLGMYERLYEGDHREVAGGLSNLAGCLETLGRAAEALPMYEASLEMRRRLFEGDHPEVAAGLNNLAYCLESLGRAAEALPKYEASLDMYERLREGDHRDVARGLNNLGNCLRSLGRAAEALPKLEESLEMERRVCADDRPEIALGLHNVAGCLHTLGRSVEALSYSEQAVEMAIVVLPDGHPWRAGITKTLERIREALARER